MKVLVILKWLSISAQVCLDASVIASVYRGVCAGPYCSPDANRASHQWHRGHCDLAADHVCLLLPGLLTLCVSRVQT